MNELNIWKCDDGSYDVLDDDGVVYQNVPPSILAQAPALLAERDRLAAINAELVAALDELRRRLWAHITLDVKKHYSLMLADSAASEVTFRAKAKQTAA